MFTYLVMHSHTNVCHRIFQIFSDLSGSGGVKSTALSDCTFKLHTLWLRASLQFKGSATHNLLFGLGIPAILGILDIRVTTTAKKGASGLKKHFTS
jgi:hypothetical protein